MANIKFSDFTGGASIVQADHFLVGFDTDATAGGSNPKNNKWSFSQVADGLIGVTAKPYSIYAADGTVSGNRVVTISSSNKLDFYAGSSQLLQLWGSSSGQFTLGRGASIGVGGAWCIGNSAEGAGSGAWCIGNSSVSRSQYNTVVGNSATDTAATNTYNTIIGSSASVTGASNAANVVIGDSALATTSGGVAVGSEARANGSKSISLGQRAQGTGNNSITLNATGSVAAPSQHLAFNVYMSSNSTPDLTIDATNGSTVNSNLKVTGQGYSELHAQTSNDLQFNWNDGNIQTATGLTGLHTFTASNPKAGATYILTLAQTGTVTPTWTGVKWSAGGTAPILSGAGKTDVITLICYDATGAGLYYGAATLDLA